MPNTKKNRTKNTKSLDKILTNSNDLTEIETKKTKTNVDDLTKSENLTKNNELNLDNNNLQKYFINREISYIQFNKRVLNEAANKSHPLLERLKFTAIFSSNLDEFFMIRVAGLKSQISVGVEELSYDGKNPSQQLKEIRENLLPLYKQQEEILNNDILPELEKCGIVFKEYHELCDKNKNKLYKYFFYNIFPILTPLMLGPANPFPRLTNRSVNIVFSLKDKSENFLMKENLSKENLIKDKPNQEKKVGILQIPAGLSRLIKLDSLSDKEKHPYILIEHLIYAFAEHLYPGCEVENANFFRVTRDADIEIAEDEAEDLLYEIKEQVVLRRWGKAPVRLEVHKTMPKEIINYLRNSLSLEESDVYELNRPMNISDFLVLMSLDIQNIKDKPFTARYLSSFKKNDVFEAINSGDILVHHPFDSYTNSVLKFLNQAADDNSVAAIKITLYRTGKDSAIIAALKRAAMAGKNVTAFVELKARFDEENNIIWAKELENSGVHVVYGVPGLKTHCKLLMVVRREQNKLKTYLHLSTGNYNQTTARLYTDLSFFTVDSDFAIDAIHLFNFLTGYSQHKEWKHFVVAPEDMKNKIIELIRHEAEVSTVENPGLIFAQFNSLAHRGIIEELFKASQKGVKIKLICRGICCLRPGVKNVSENIEIHSVLGRFLEHSRIYHFKNSATFLGSADLMTRNMHRRVELLFPIKNKNLENKLMKLLDNYWKDNTKSWILRSDGEYEKIVQQKGERKFSAQQYYLDQLKRLN